VELDPKYVQVIVTRWEAFTGQTAQRGLDFFRSFQDFQLRGSYGFHLAMCPLLKLFTTAFQQNVEIMSI